MVMSATLFACHCVKAINLLLKSTNSNSCNGSCSRGGESVGGGRSWQDICQKKRKCYRAIFFRGTEDQSDRWALACPRNAFQVRLNTAKSRISSFLNSPRTSRPPIYKFPSCLVRVSSASSQSPRDRCERGFLRYFFPLPP